MRNLAANVHTASVTLDDELLYIVLNVADRIPASRKRVDREAIIVSNLKWHHRLPGSKSVVSGERWSRAIRQRPDRFRVGSGGSRARGVRRGCSRSRRRCTLY